VKYPNPEEREAFLLALELAQEIGADLIVGTDPDCDRVGVVVKRPDGEYEVLTGNQTGALLMHYLLSERQKQDDIPANATVVKTIVTSELGAAIAQKYGVETVNTLTGFKYIGEKIRQWEESGEKTFLFGYEESYGYLAGTFVRDKDGVMSTMLICEMAAFYKKQGKTLYDALVALYEEFGYYKEALVSRTLKGIDGMKQMQAIMQAWRERPPVDLDGQRVAVRRDYLARVAVHEESGREEPLTLPKENVLHYTMQDGSWVCLRPSGTEPKIKVYFSVRGETGAEAELKLSKLMEAVLARVKG
jgi:phosphoglucomutase